MYSMAHLKPFKEPPTLAAASTSEGKIGTEIAVSDTEPETPTEDFRKVDGTVSHDSTVKNIEVTAMEEEKYVGQDVSNNDSSDADDNFDDMLVKEVEDKQWILKVKFIMITKHTERLEAKVRNIKVYGSSFHCLKPRSWISDEVYLSTTKHVFVNGIDSSNIIEIVPFLSSCVVGVRSSVILASIPCITEGTNQDYLTDEKKEYNCKKCA
nr:uncharacterized protein LOC125637395 [Caretta caretta]